MNTITSIHNRDIPPMPEGQSILVWLPVGEAVIISECMALALTVERRGASDGLQLVLSVHSRSGAVMTAQSPEALRHLTTDAVVRRVDSDDAHGPMRALVEIGDMVAYPQLRERAA